MLVRYDEFCAVPPHPDLGDRWLVELERVRESGAGAASALGLARKPRRLGFDDGVIIPPDEYPVGTPLGVIASAAADRAPLRGTVRVIVVLVQFSDKAMGQTADHYRDLFFSTGVLPTGSVKEYYSEVTNGLVTLSGDVVGPFTMPQTLAWYANNNFGIAKGPGDFRSPQLAHDAAVAADPSVNFQPYDNDGNGFVDAFIVVHAGPGGEVTGNAGDVWSHKATLPAAYATDSTKLYGYLTIPEDAKIGVCAHELGHLLFGFPDLYDTDYSSGGIGNWCLMAGGTWNGGGDVPAHPSAWCKANQGWASVTNVTANGSVSILDVKASHNLLRLWKNGAAGPEYFLVENRQRSGFDAQLPGDGLLVWHIDENQSGNTDENHYKVALLQGDGKRDLELNRNRGDGGDPYPGTASATSVTSSTTPGTKSYAGADTCVSISSISASDPTMTATLTVRCGKTLIKDLKDGPKEIKDNGKEIAKEVGKDGKELKEFKERKEGKEIKEIKEGGKDGKELKEARADKPFDKRLDKPFDRRPGGGGDPGGFTSDVDRTAELEERVAALEGIVHGAAAQPFIGTDLRPDLTGGPSYADPNAGRMASGDAMAKREYDAPAR